MKLYFSFFVFLFLTASISAQIDSRNNSISIPAIESPKDSSSSKSILPVKPIESQNTFKGLTTPNVVPQLSLPKKEFSMTGGEVFGNPGELYTKTLDKHMDNIRQEMYLGSKGSEVDVYYGEIKTKSEYVLVQYRDYGAQDGDLIRVLVNDEIVEFRIYLTNAFKGFRLDLKEGYNKIDFLALNEGTSMPNTAHFKIIDDQKKTLASDFWALATNVKATINVVRVVDKE